MGRIGLCLTACAALAACAGPEPRHEPALVVFSSADAFPAPPGIVVQTVALRPGTGSVEAILPMLDGNGSIRRLSVRMDDGSLQLADSRGPYISIGTRVEITPDSHIRYHGYRGHPLERVHQAREARELRREIGG